MFNTYKIGSKNISTRNLVLLFFTIVFGFASVITLANVDIVSDIENARQTIGRITITSDGTNDGIRYFDFNYSGDGRTFINTNALISQSSFSGKVLGIDDDGNLIYVASTNLVVSGAGGGIGGDGYRTGYGSDIWNVNLGGKVGIGTDTPIGKLHITSSGETDVYIEEKAAGKAASLRLLTPLGTTWIVGGDSDPNIFFIGTLGHQEYFAMTTGGFVGIGTIDPKAKLQVVGTFIAGNYNNSLNNSIYSSIVGGSNDTITGNYSFIGGGLSNNINGDFISIGGGHHHNIVGESSIIGGGMRNSIAGYRSTIGGGQGNNLTGNNSYIGGGIGHGIIGLGSFIGGGNSNTISGNYSSIVGGEKGNTIVGNSSFIGGGQSNTINGVDYANIVGGQSNHIYGGTNTFIGGGVSNVISGNSNNSFIGGGGNNHIINAINSFVGGQYAQALYNNSFVRNTIATGFASTKPGQFIINAPYDEKGVKGGVGINTNTPTAALDVSGNIVAQTLYGANINITASSILGESAQLRPSSIDTQVGCAIYDEGKIVYVAGSFYGCDGSHIWKRLNN